MKRCANSGSLATSGWAILRATVLASQESTRYLPSSRCPAGGRESVMSIAMQFRGAEVALPRLPQGRGQALCQAAAGGRCAVTDGAPGAGSGAGLPGRIVIAGAGLAGLRTAEELRGRGYSGSITLIGAEHRPPYDRPPLSKQLMLGKADDATLLSAESGLEVDLRLGERAEGFEADGQRGGLLRSDRGSHRFDRLVLATGARPVSLPGQGRQRFLRTMDDALALRALLRPGLRLAIVGAGWIGAELATAAAAAGAAVTVVEAGPAPLAAALGADIGKLTVPWYAAAGVDLRLSTPVASVEDG